MSIAVALDNSVLGDVTDKRIPESKREDKKAIEKIIELARKGEIELGVAVTGALMEEQAAGEPTRQALMRELQGILHIWPVVAPPCLHAEIEYQKACLEKILQDKEGTDSGIFLVSTLHARYFLTTDYRFHRQFKKEERRIREDCGITAHVLTPSEFLAKYISGAVSCFQKDV